MRAGCVSGCDSRCGSVMPSGLTDALTRAEFRDSGDPHTIVYDTLAERLGDVRNGAWVRKAEESWHRSLLRRTA